MVLYSRDDERSPAMTNATYQLKQQGQTTGRSGTPGRRALFCRSLRGFTMSKSSTVLSRVRRSMCTRTVCGQAGSLTGCNAAVKWCAFPRWASRILVDSGPLDPIPYLKGAHAARMCPYFIRGYTASLPQGWLHNALHSSRQSSRCFTALVDRSTIISTMFKPEVWGFIWHEMHKAAPT